jgi:hydrogenase maturation protease
MHTLVIGFGNILRGDDGVGVAAAEAVNAWHLDGVKVLTCQQLTPELVAELAHARRVLFIDATLSAGDYPFTSAVVIAKPSRGPLGHHETPANLLALTRELEGTAPVAWLVTIRADTFEHGSALSPNAQTHLIAALDWIRAWLTREN